ncbi:MAG TPA: NAD(P)-binding domain-containing protein, partial [Chitinophagaceae bacterium]|nr:NAD(P)-binding domain-containing protein [Chitinophagaceae bacterium]
MNNGSFDLGMIGLGVMGRNLLLNVADHGYLGIGYDKDPAKGAALLSSAKDPSKLRSAESFIDLVNHLSLPRKLLMLVPAGPIVDSVISDILPLLNKGDILIDGGNSHYTDTLRRVNFMKEKGIHFVGMGVSGGEQGARTGPCIMPGGDRDAWMNMKPLLESIA